MQFDVYENENAATRKEFPYLLDVQSDLLEALESRVVVPLADRKIYSIKLQTLVMPVFNVEGIEVVAVTTQIAGLSRRLLKTRVASLTQARTEIIAALDFIFTGY